MHRYVPRCMYVAAYYHTPAICFYILRVFNDVFLNKLNIVDIFQFATFATFIT